MNTVQYNKFSPYLQRILDGSDTLPSLPSITLKVREAIADSSTTHFKLASIINSDPGLSALILKTASSALYFSENPPTTLETAIAKLGMQAVENLVMMHTVKSLFVIKHRVLKELFEKIWQRQRIKSGLSAFLAQQLDYQPFEEVLMAAMLTEIGSMAILSAFRDHNDVPDVKVYLALYRKYSRVLGSQLLTRWNIDTKLVTVTMLRGNWERTDRENPSLLDIINLATYHSVVWRGNQSSLPPLEKLPAFKKLPKGLQEIADDGGLQIIRDNYLEIQALIQTL